MARAVVVLLFLIFFMWAVLVPSLASGAAAIWSPPSPEPTPRPSKKAPVSQKPAQVPREFPHDVKEHRQRCDSCHKFPSSNWESVRKKEDAFPDITDYPKHESCVQCHRQQFFKGSPPNICSVCHATPGPRDSARHPFPNPREIFDLSPKGKSAESDFVVGFPHGKHMELLGLSVRAVTQDVGGPSGRSEPADQNAVCATCHSTISPQDDSEEEYFSKPPADLGDGYWLKKGSFKSSPIGHTTCFTCHSADTGIAPAPSDCGTCHNLREKYQGDLDPGFVERTKGLDKSMVLAWRKRASAANFRHEWFSHAELECNSCHETNSMETATVAGRKVKVLSCGGAGIGCHVTQTSDDGGILNLEVDSRKTNASFACVKCHQEFGRKSIPQSHLDAIKKIAEQK